MKQIECEVKTVEQLTPDVLSVGLQPLSLFVFRSGQAISIELAPGLKRFFSIASAPETRPLELCIKIVPGTPEEDKLRELKAGERFQLEGPFGELHFQPTHRPVYFIAAGTGIAPFRSMMLSKSFEKSRPGRVTVLFGARREADLLPSDYLEDKIENLLWLPCLSDPSPRWTGFKGRTTDFLRSNEAQEIFDFKNGEFYLCGKPAMMLEVRRLLIRQGVDESLIYHEKLKASDLKKSKKRGRFWDRLRLSDHPA